MVIACASSGFKRLILQGCLVDTWSSLRLSQWRWRNLKRWSYINLSRPTWPQGNETKHKPCVHFCLCVYFLVCIIEHFRRTKTSMTVRTLNLELPQHGLFIWSNVIYTLCIWSQFSRSVGAILTLELLPPSCWHTVRDWHISGPLRTK